MTIDDDINATHRLLCVIHAEMAAAAARLGVSQRVASDMAMAVEEQLRLQFGRQRVYIPCSQADKRERDANVLLMRAKGMTWGEIGRRVGLTGFACLKIYRRHLDTNAKTLTS